MHSLARSIALGLLLAASATQAAPWTYRGTLNDGGAPANGRYGIRLSLLDAADAARVQRLRRVRRAAATIARSPKPQRLRSASTSPKSWRA